MGGFLFLAGIEQERGRENSSFPVSEGSERSERRKTEGFRVFFSIVST